MHGWLILDKPLGLTSAQAVTKVKRLIKPSKIGHAGTLDPLASGVLPLAIGEATKTVPFAMDKIKEYRFTVTWGEARATDDAEGEVIARSDKRPTQKEIEAILPRFTGTILQAPPAYSAIKVAGKRAYALARQGEAVELKARQVQVDSLLLLPEGEGISFPVEKSDFIVRCGKGTYIRSLGRDMAECLGTHGYISSLRRTAVQPFSEAHAISLEILENLVHKGSPATWLLPVESVLDDILAWETDSTLAVRLKTGNPIHLIPKQRINDHCCFGDLQNGTLVRARLEDTLLALCRVNDGVMKPERVFNLVTSDR